MEGFELPPTNAKTESATACGDDETEMLLSLLSEVEEQLAISRGCVHDASNKFEEGKEFEVRARCIVQTAIQNASEGRLLDWFQVAAAERAKDAQLSETTRRKLQRRAQAMMYPLHLLCIPLRTLTFHLKLEEDHYFPPTAS